MNSEFIIANLNSGRLNIVHGQNSILRLQVANHAADDRLLTGFLLAGLVPLPNGFAGVGFKPCNASGAKSAPFGQQTVPHVASSFTFRKYSAFFSG